MSVERYGSNADNSVPKSVKSPLQAGQREMLPDQIRREIERYPDERAGLDAHDLNVPIIPPGILEAQEKTEIDFPRNERNPYLQGVASPSTVYVCPFCNRLTAREGMGHGDIVDPHLHEFEVEEV